MSTKTITVTEDAYEALSSLKQPRESFSDTILRVSKRKPLIDFFGVISRESANVMEQSITDFRKRRVSRNISRHTRIAKEFKS